MKVRIKFDTPNINTGNSEHSESNGAKQSAFFEIDLNFLHMAYTMFPPHTMGFSINVTKAIENLLNLNKKTYLKEVDTTGLMLANGHDIYNYVARFGAANFQIQPVLKFDSRLDYEKLVKAVRLSLDAEPVFGCRIAQNNPPYWKRLENIDNIKFCSYEETSDEKLAIQRFLESPLDMDKDPMVKMRLIRSGVSDTLCLKVNHTCCDGTGTKEYLNLLADIYTYIDSNEVFVPKPSTRSRNDQDRLFEALGIKDPESAWTGELESQKNLWEFPWYKNKPSNARSIYTQLPPGHLDVLSRYGKAKGATINDILLTAYYRAMFEMSKPQYGLPMNISMTVDLRRYLPDQKTEAIRCFSGGFDTKLERIKDEPFEGTLSRVVSMMKKIKDGYPGLQSAVGLERVERAKFSETLDYYRNASMFLGWFNQGAPILSNLGILEKSLIRFGKHTVIDAYIVPPAISAPGILICIGTYNDTMTMAISYYETQVRRENIEKVLTLIKKELIEGCRT